MCMDGIVYKEICMEYVELLQTNNIQISMTENGLRENAVTERVNGTLKEEW